MYARPMEGQEEGWREELAAELLREAWRATEEGDEGRAESLLRQASVLLPESAAPLVGISQIEAGRGRFEEALKVAARACVVEPGSARAWMNRGFIALAWGEYREAAESLERGLALGGEELGQLVQVGADALRFLREVSSFVAGLDRAGVLAVLAEGIAAGVGEERLLSLPRGEEVLELLRGWSGAMEEAPSLVRGDPLDYVPVLREGAVAGFRLAAVEGADFLPYLVLAARIPDRRTEAMLTAVAEDPEIPEQAREALVGLLREEMGGG